MSDRILQDSLNRLLKITNLCRDDMHEPDEQSIKGHVYGDHLDNAAGNKPHFPSAYGLGQDGPFPHAEFVVCIENEDELTYEWFNLATLIALARKAVV